MEEAWKPIPGFEGRYEVSDLGRVRSLNFRGVCGPAVMRTTKNHNGYHVVSLGSKPKKQFRLHCLVLEAFVGPRPPGMQGCHGRDDKDDNRLENLRWDTPKRNIAERQSFDGEKNPNAKLTNAQTQELKRRVHAGESRDALAAEFGISLTRVRQLCGPISACRPSTSSQCPA